MKWFCCAVASFYCAVALSGCGSSVSGKTLVGSYNVTISQSGKSDPDVMTVTLGSSNSILLTFEAGITTDAGGPDPDGLRGTLKTNTTFTLDSQPAHIDHSTGELDGSISGSGTIGSDGTCTVTLDFVASGTTAPLEYDVAGTKLD